MPGKSRTITGKSYSNKFGNIDRCLAVLVAVLVSASCTDKNGSFMFRKTEEAADAYRTYLYKVRAAGELSTEGLADAVNEWRTLRDSVYACIGRDTTAKAHPGYVGAIRELHDSLRDEFTRLSSSRPWTFADVLFLMERASPYRQDTGLMRSAASGGPFFEALDSIPPYRKDAQGIVYDYRSFLDRTLESGIGGWEELLSFIKEEDRLFRSYLIHLPELADSDLSAITEGTEKCCLGVFQAAEEGRIPYDEALLYMAKRTGRRIILNAGTCLEDVREGRVATEGQARAYIWMLLQPYITLDAFGVAVLSDADYARLQEIAGRTPQTLAELDGIIGTCNDQWRELPSLLIKITLNSI